MTFEEYWETDGSRKDAADHKERARLAWKACEADWQKWRNDLDKKVIWLNEKHPRGK